MQRNIYLQGELAERFGRKFVVNTENYSDIFKCIQANRPDFVPYLRECHENDIGFILDTEETGALDHTDLLAPVSKGDITLALAPAGSKSGIAKILAAIAIIAVIYFTAISTQQQPQVSAQQLRQHQPPPPQVLLLRVPCWQCLQQT